MNLKFINFFKIDKDINCNKRKLYQDSFLFLGMNISQLIIGIVFCVVGLFLIILSFFGFWPVIFYGIILLVLGGVILLNKNEDKIEERKDLNKKKDNK
jgi:hypothetical protein